MILRNTRNVRNVGRTALRIARQIVILVITLAIGGFLGSLLLRYGPGFNTDERDLDQRYSSATLEALHKARSGEQNIVHFYFNYLANAAHGDLGVSTALQQPVGQLIADRAPATLRLIGLGLSAGWIAGLVLGIVSAVRPRGTLPLVSDFLAGLFLCFPAAVLALMLFLSGGPAALAIAAAIFPRVYRYSRALIADSLALPYVLAAAARGISRSRILVRYVLPPAIAPMAALLGVSITLAFGAAIPVEVICDVPGLGQLAWKAAIARDLPLLAAMTLMVTGVTLAANSAAGLAK
jgi:peptide/nickel transport system permease protein